MSNAADPADGTRPLRRAALAGGIAGVLVCAGWYAVAAGTDTVQAYLIPACGVAVAFGVHRGMRAPGRDAALLSVGITVVLTLLTLYYVQRHVVLYDFAQHGQPFSIPLVPYLDWLVEVLRYAFANSTSVIGYALAAVVAAGWFGFHGFDPHDSERRR